MNRVDGERAIDQADIDRYLACLDEIKWRINYVASLQGQMTSWTYEKAALQLRQSLELVVMGSLVTNRRAVEEVASAFAKHDVKAARKVVSQVNPAYWPRPVRNETRSDGPDALVEINDDYLREEEWGKAWGRMSAILHARNPFGPAVNYDTQAQRIRTVTRRLIALVSTHWISLPETGSGLLAVMMAPHGGIAVHEMEAVPKRSG